MAKSEQQKQRKLAKKKSKDRQNRKLVAQRQQQMSSLAGQMTAAASGTIEGCYIAKACYDGTGIGTVSIIRRLPSGQRAYGLFLVDAFCLGCKDALGKMCSANQVSDILEDLRRKDPIEPIEPGVARAYVEAAIEYARSLGFAPHPDYRKVSPIWGDIEALPLTDKFRFGRDGQPAYIAGPYDDHARQTMIINTLTKTVGEGNFEFMLASSTHSLQEFSEADLDDLVFDQDDDDDAIDGSVVQRIDRGVHDE